MSSLIDKLPLPEFKIEQLKDLQVEVFPTREVQVDNSPDLCWTKQAAPFDCLFRQQIVN